MSDFTSEPHEIDGRLGSHELGQQNLIEALTEAALRAAFSFQGQF